MKTLSRLITNIWNGEQPSSINVSLTVIIWANRTMQTANWHSSVSIKNDLFSNKRVSSLDLKSNNINRLGILHIPFFILIVDVNFDWTGQCSTGPLEMFERAWSTHSHIRYCLLISIIAGNDNCIRALVIAFQTKSREILWKPTMLFSCTSITCHEYLVNLISLSLVARCHEESMHHQQSNKLRNYLCINQSDQSV